MSPSSLTEAQSIDRDAYPLPEAPKPVGNYLPVVQTGNLLMTSGMIPMQAGKLLYSGAVGSIGVSLEDAQAAARICILNGLAAIKQHLGGSLTSVKRVVKITGFVASAPSFFQQPQVMNAASDLLVEILGEAGKHARSAVGVYALPLEASVEIELTVEV